MQLSLAASLGGILLAGLGVTIWTNFAAAQPTLSISPLGSNQFSITVSNSVSTNYTLEWTPVLGDTNYEWQALWGIEGSNATFDAGSSSAGWFRVKVGIDGDQDGIPPWIDANDDDSSVGALTVTIDSPLNGATLN